MNRRRAALIFVQAVLGLACLYAAFRMSDQFDRRMLTANWPWIGLLAVGWGVNQLVCAWRLGILLALIDIRLPYLAVLRLTLSSFIAASVLPGAFAGDVAKIALLKLNLTRVRVGDIAVIALIDRSLGFLSLWIVSFLASFLIEAPQTHAAANLVQFVRIGLVLVALVGFVMLIGAKMLEQLIDRLGTALPVRIGTMVHLMLRIARDRKALVTVVVHAGAVSLLAVVALVGSQAWVGSEIMRSVGQAPAILLQSFLAPVSIVVSSLPITPSGVGVGQLTLGMAYGIMKLPSEVAVTLASLVQLGQLALACAAAPIVLRASTASRDRAA